MAYVTTSPEISRASIGLRSERGPVLLAVMLSTGLVAIDATILATAVPAVVGDLGGFTQFPWLFSVYLLGQAVTVPLYGKLSDQFGRKPVLLAGVTIFVVASLLCGFAWSMGSLIVFRAVQGLGAGAILPIGMTVIGDIYSMEERAKVQGYVASVWAAASLVGPTLGGVFSDYLSWRGIFLVNLPIGAAAMWMLWKRFDESVVKARHRIDVLGAVLLSVAGVALLLALLEGGVRWAWDSPTSVLLFAVALVVGVGFVLVERRAAEPVLPLWVFRSRVLDAAMLSSFLVGVLVMGLSSYVPLYVQVVLGHDALVAGLALAAMTMGWPIAASQAGRLYLRYGFRVTLVSGGVLAVIGAGLLQGVGSGSSVWYVGAACFVMGLGFGLVAAPLVVAAQASVTWESRGVATGAAMFTRSVGSSVGVAVFGAIANGLVAARLGHVSTDLESLPAADLAPAVETVFLASAAIAVVLLASSFWMPARPAVPEATDR